MDYVNECNRLQASILNTIKTFVNEWNDDFVSSYYGTLSWHMFVIRDKKSDFSIILNVNTESICDDEIYIDIHTAIVIKKHFPEWDNSKYSHNKDMINKQFKVNDNIVDFLQQTFNMCYLKK